MLVQEPEQLEGENDAVTPLGRPEIENCGLALPVTVALIELLTTPPCITETDVGLADRAMLAFKWYSYAPRS